MNVYYFLTPSGFVLADFDGPKKKSLCPECKEAPSAPYLQTHSLGFYICRTLGCKNMLQYHESVQEYLERAMVKNPGFTGKPPWEG